ncbi:hypothetical protein ASPZODRAFT_106685 [Penicilliopsis zonata CBS 506.65]|uniref:Transcription factor CBF/NF-Y/archaeal histone domain-containing protein n=1 Tax=Penicilliopsis zonata CBS 506.65 TaxID=1073090 RepID=A0A1L9SUD4_9EURO|nr:hypothetical protein ASPZODRAFT_106685 [Penicilliopsis zonata CBS 506.65]OJJ50808.1 hypothetical protein ASPZODRAFT_106685 [Penicilliopsis zonata CBS 506.65]
MSPKQNTGAQEITGQAALPVSRIKKIIQLDDDIVQCSQNATFLISVATEMFIQYLAEQGHNVIKSERKPRKIIQYKDLATAVSRIDNLEFLSDVIPKTTTYKQFKEGKTKEAPRSGPSAAAAVEKGQRTLNGALAIDDDHTQSPNRRPPTVTHASGSLSTLMVDRTVDSSTQGLDPDVEMAD